MTLHSHSREASYGVIDQTTSPIPLSDLPLAASDSAQSLPEDAAEESNSLCGDTSRYGQRAPASVTASVISAARTRAQGYDNPGNAEWKNTYIKSDAIPPYVPMRTTGHDLDPGDHVRSTIRIGPSVASSGPNGAWTTCVKALREHDQHLVQGWKEDVDSLLVFAGLFSAVVTAFNIESYKLLQEDPDEKTAGLLSQISAQLATNTGKTPQSPVPRGTPFVPDSRSVRINILWFSSLVLSLVSASVGILTKQWLREYTRNAASSPRENARIRQLRHEGFVRWNVPFTIALLPILLQVALALFFAGLLDLLWSLHSSVAGVITTIVTLSLAFLIITTIMPTFRGDCPYKSPQAFGIYLVMQGLARLLSLAAHKTYSWLGWDRPKWPLVIDPSMFRRWRRLLAAWLLNLIHRRFFNSWREREMAIVHESAAQLDHRVLADADATFMEDDFLCRTISFCLNDTECPAAVDCLCEIITHRADTKMGGIPHWRHRDTVDSGVNLLLHLILDVLPRMDRADRAGIDKMLTLADSLCRAIPFETEHYDTVTLYQRLFDVLARFLTYEDLIKMRAFGIMQRMWARSRAPIHAVVIQRIISFAHTAKHDSDYNTFHVACEMTLAFSTAATFPRIDFDSITNELRLMLADLEVYFTTPDSETGALGSGQSVSILLALEELNEIDPCLIVNTKLRELLDSVKVRGPIRVDADSMSSFWRGRLEYARLLREYRERYPQATMGRRRNTTAPRSNVLDLDIVRAATQQTDVPLAAAPPSAPPSVQGTSDFPKKPSCSQAAAAAPAESPVLPSISLDVLSMRTPSLLSEGSPSGDNPEWSLSMGHYSGSLEASASATAVNVQESPRSLTRVQDDQGGKSQSAFQDRLRRREDMLPFNWYSIVPLPAQLSCLRPPSESPS